MIKNIGEYYGKRCLSHPDLPHEYYILITLDNSLLDESMGELDPYVEGLVNRAYKTCTQMLNFQNNAGKSVYGVLADNIPASILQAILDLATYLQHKAAIATEPLHDLIDIKGFEFHDLAYECSAETVINGDLIRYSRDMTKKMINIGDYKLEDIIQLDRTKITFGHVTRNKLEIEEWTQSDN